MLEDLCVGVIRSYVLAMSKCVCACAFVYGEGEACM